MLPHKATRPRDYHPGAASSAISEARFINRTSGCASRSRCHYESSRYGSRGQRSARCTCAVPRRDHGMHCGLPLRFRSGSNTWASGAVEQPETCLSPTSVRGPEERSSKAPSSVSTRIRRSRQHRLQSGKGGQQCSPPHPHCFLARGLKLRALTLALAMPIDDANAGPRTYGAVSWPGVVRADAVG